MGNGESEASQTERGLILDACVVLNLWASRRIVEILWTLPKPCAVAEYVRDHEAIWVGRHRHGPAADYERVDLSVLVSAELVEVLALEGEEEMAHFIALASSPALDDGEAMTGALAHSRGLVVATDDRAALTTFARHDPPIPTRSTASLVKDWVVCASVDKVTLRATLIDIRERACFEPGPRDPLQGWWRDAIGAG